MSSHKFIVTQSIFFIDICINYLACFILGNYINGYSFKLLIRINVIIQVHCRLMHLLLHLHQLFGAFILGNINGHIYNTIVYFNVYFLSVFAPQSRPYASHSRTSIATKSPECKLTNHWSVLRSTLALT